MLYRGFFSGVDYLFVAQTYGQGKFPSLFEVDTGRGVETATGVELANGIFQTILDCVRVREKKLSCHVCGVTLSFISRSHFVKRRRRQPLLGGRQRQVGRRQLLLLLVRCWSARQ